MKKQTFVVYALLWVLMMAISFFQQREEIKGAAKQIAIRQAEILVENLALLQAKYSRYESIYAPVTEMIPPIPNISIPERDLESSDGRKFTRIAPYCSNMPIDLPESGIRVHFTSLIPINAGNKPDLWELSALTGFQNGATTRIGATRINGEEYYRFIKSMPFEDGCRTCHVQAAEAMGTTLAAISAAVPAASIDSFVAERLQKLQVSYFILAIFGLILILIAFLLHKKLVQRLTKAKRQLKLAYMDVLTQLPNRRYYDYFVNREWKRAMRLNYPLSMIMIDIDYFKNYNDYYGHIQGDYCLQQVAKTLRYYFRREGDLIARYGGEEFCVVAACEAAQATRLAEILRVSVEELKIPHHDSEASPYVTISLGAATVVPTESKSYEDLLQVADLCLYQAKLKGRNRVESYQSENC